MKIPRQFLKDADKMPPPLRSLLEAELAAGNQVVEVGHSFPAPPAGAYFKLARPITTRPRESGDDLHFYDHDTPYYSGEFTDSKRFFFILEPPHPPPPEPDMDAIRAAHEPAPSAPGVRPTPKGANDSALGRFESSMVIDYEKWHDGIGYDLEALGQATPVEREIVERILINRSPRDWRDIEALAELDTPRARKALKAAMSDSNPEVRMAVIGYAPGLVPAAQRNAALVQSLHEAELFGGLSQALDLVEEFHPPEVIAELFRGVLERKGEVAVHFAAMLLFVHDKTSEPFDMKLRPFFLRFNTDDANERQEAFRELCRMIGVRAEDHLHPSARRRPSGGNLKME